MSLGGLRSLIARQSVDAVRDGVAAHDSKGRLVAWTPQAEAITGWTEEEAAGRVPPDLPEGLLDLGDGRWVVVRHPDPGFGRRYKLTLLADAREQVALHDAHRKLKELATIDPLTGLPNRGLLIDRLGQALALARRERRTVALLVVGLDGLADITDSLGHEAGEEVMRVMAARIGQRVRSSDTVGLASADAFAVILTAVARPEDAPLVAQNMLTSLAEPLTVRGQELHLTAGLGFATSPRDGTDAALLLQHAEVAMHAARSRGTGVVQEFSASMAVAAHERMSLRTSLQRALDRGELMLHYQPQVDARTNRVVAVEALVRWEHPEMGLLGPPSFLPLAEETGLIVAIDRFVVRTACGQAAAWEAEGLDIGRVAVNVSARTLEDEGFVEAVAAALHEWQLQPSMLEVEIAESSLLHSFGHAAETIEGLKRLGVSIAIDDFGASFTSLQYLKRFSFDTLKIDPMFVADATSEPSGASTDAAILRSIVALADGLGLRLVAEGVETEGQRDTLRFLSCDVMQGLLVRHPVPPADLGELLRTAGRRRLRRRGIA